MQLTQLACLGLSHHTARVEEREYFAGVAQTAARNPAIGELAVLSTCNRVELYGVVDATAGDPYDLLLDFLASLHPRPLDSFLPQIYSYSGEEAVRHLCRVATGLESLVVGEAQVLGQVNQAYQAAQEARLSGSLLSLAFQQAIRAGKRARNETAIGEHAASTASVAVDLAKRHAGNLAEKRVLVVGTGEIGQVTIKVLRKVGVTQLALANRTVATAATLAATWRGQVYGLEQLHEALVWAEVVITAASVRHPLINRNLLQSVMQQRAEQPLVLVDLAVPRNVAIDVDGLVGVERFDVDDLRRAAEDAVQARQSEIPQVEAIIEQEVAIFLHKFHELRVGPLISQLRQRAEAIRQQEVARSLRSLGKVDEQTVAQMEQMSRALVNKLLHEPTVQLKKRAEQGTIYQSLFRHLFDLPSEEA